MILLLSSICITGILICFDIWLHRYRHKFHEEFENANDKTYFEELSIMEQKTWLAEEIFREKSFEIKMLSKEQTKKLKAAKCIRVAEVFETFCYNPMFCPSYQAKFNYLHSRLRYYNEYSSKDFTTPIVLGAYNVKNESDYEEQ